MRDTQLIDNYKRSLIDSFNACRTVYSEAILSNNNQLYVAALGTMVNVLNAMQLCDMVDEVEKLPQITHFRQLIAEYTTQQIQNLIERKEIENEN